MPVWRDQRVIAVQYICVPWLLGAKMVANSILSDVWCFLKAYWSSLYRSFLATFILLTLFTMLQWRDGYEPLFPYCIPLPCRFDPFSTRKCRSGQFSYSLGDVPVCQTLGDRVKDTDLSIDVDENSPEKENSVWQLLRQGYGSSSLAVQN